MMSEEELNKMYEKINTRMTMERLNGEINLSDDTKDKIELYNEVIRLKFTLNELKGILNMQLAFTSSYQLNYENAMMIIDQAKNTIEYLEKGKN
jgi:hypothetical protein